MPEKEKLQNIHICAPIKVFITNHLKQKN